MEFNVNTFIADWKNTKAYPSLSDLSARYGMTNAELAHKASELRGKGFDLVCRRHSRISDGDLMSMYRNTDRYPTSKAVAMAVGLDLEGLLVRVCKLRALHGTDMVPYRGVHKGKEKSGKAKS